MNNKQVLKALECNSTIQKSYRIFCLLCVVTSLYFCVSAQTSSESQFNLAISLQRQNKWVEAADAYQKFLKIEPNHAGAFANLGVVLTRLGKYEEALAAYETALRISPQLTAVLFNLGSLNFQIGKFQNATEILKQYLIKNPGDNRAVFLIGVSLLELDSYSESLNYLESAVVGNSNNPNGPNTLAIQYSLGLAYLRLKRDEVKNVIQNLNNTSGGEAFALLLKGHIHLYKSEYRGAIESFEAAAKLNNDLPRLHFSLGTAYLRAAMNNDALFNFNEELKKIPADFWSNYYAAYILEADGKLDQAVIHLSTALKTNNESFEANTLLGKTLLKRGNAKTAITPLEKAVSINPKDSNTRFQLARAYQMVGRRDDAAREFAIVKKLKDESLEKEKSN